MTVPSYPARPRPTIVTTAVSLLYVVAGIEVINALVAFSTSGQMTDAVRDVYAGTEAEGAESFVSIVFVGGGVINLLLGLGFAVLAFFDGRGKNPSRIVTWVIGGISLCCFGANLGGTALVGAMDTGSTTAGGPTQDEVQQRIDSAMPSWYTPTTTTLAVIALLAILATVILLALPPANEFFRKRTAAAWDPSIPYPGGPGGPGGLGGYSPYPVQPGQPPYPGQPGQSPYPGQSGYPPYQGQPGQPPYAGPSYPAQQGQPGQPAPGLPPYPGQGTPGQPPASDPYAPPPADPNPPPTSGDQPPRPPTDPA